MNSMVERSETGWYSQTKSISPDEAGELLSCYETLTVWTGIDKDDESQALLIAPELPPSFVAGGGGGHCLKPDTMVCLGEFPNAEAWDVFNAHNRMLESRGGYYS